VSLATPDKIRTLQRALYVKAKQEPTRRFHFLYDKVWREDILAYAYACCRANGGAPGVEEKLLPTLRNTAWAAGSRQYGRRFEQAATHHSRSNA
jgi:RNA-directed DNA polymerase